MKKVFINILSIIALGALMSACSNLDESVYNPAPAEESVIYSETFESSLGDFTAFSVTGDESWSYYSSGYAIISGYVDGSNFANEDWLISPEIDLSDVTTSHLTFDHVARYFSNLADEATVWVSEDYTDGESPADAGWTKLEPKAFSDPGDWTFSSSGEISLTQYAGKKIRVAFKYLSTTTKAGTWELKNFLIKRGEATVDAVSLFYNSFGGSKGDFTAISVIGDQQWTYSSQYSCMVMSGFSGSRYANEDWLVSPEIDLTSVENSYVTFDHAGNYFGTPANEATVWVSEDYTDSTNFASATWSQLNIMNYFSNSSYTFVNSGKMDLSAYAGKKVHVALKYTSTSSVSGTWEVRNFYVYEGKVDGNEENPYTVSQAISSQSGAYVWVEGYVVGYVWPDADIPYTMSADTCTQMTNILLADSTINVYESRILAVQLPRGGIRNGLNLKSNPSILGQKIKIKGTLSSNLGIAGILNSTNYILPNGTTGVSTTTTLFSETFDSSLGDFTTNNVVGSQYWKYSSGYGVAMSGYANSTSNANEDWLISPEIDMTLISSAGLSFDHTINKGVVANMPTEQTLWITTDNGANWSQLFIPTYPAGSNWTFVNSGEISLDAYAGQKIKIGFKYISTSSSSATWEIKNILIYY
ncbi:MAG: choice-of-anchor J domain-containing protein [Paludibacter sp.]|nr:choice-of-anchor J domain-containing protein [Paludibacter sp.]